jgi:hypothetical protein
MQLVLNRQRLVTRFAEKEGLTDFAPIMLIVRKDMKCGLEFL